MKKTFVYRFLFHTQIYQDGVLLGYIDAANSKYGKWMILIQCARHVGEQNLRAVQPYNGCLYFETTRDVAAHEELLVWYDEEQYGLYMGVPSRCRMIAGTHVFLRASSTNLYSLVRRAAAPSGVRE